MLRVSVCVMAITIKASASLWCGFLDKSITSWIWTTPKFRFKSQKCRKTNPLSNMNCQWKFLTLSITTNSLNLAFSIYRKLPLPRLGVSYMKISHFFNRTEFRITSKTYADLNNFLLTFGIEKPRISYNLGDPKWYIMGPNIANNAKYQTYPNCIIRASANRTSR